MGLCWFAPIDSEGYWNLVYNLLLFDFQETFSSFIPFSYFIHSIHFIFPRKKKTTMVEKFVGGGGGGGIMLLFLLCATFLGLSMVDAEDPFRFCDWNVTYGDIYALAVRQQV